jgi:hypothetical protein
MFSRLTNNCNFTSLETLILGLETLELCKPRAVSYSEAMCNFLCSVRPLKEICILADLTYRTTCTVLDCHGKPLRKLILWQSFHAENRLVLTREDAQNIEDCCPRLTELSLTISRSKGYSHESAIYRALGSISQLQDLFLTLDATYIAPGQEDEETGEYSYDTPLPNNPSFDAFDQQVYKYQGHTGRFWNRREARNGHIPATHSSMVPWMRIWLALSLPHFNWQSFWCNTTGDAQSCVRWSLYI